MGHWNTETGKDEEITEMHIHVEHGGEKNLQRNLRKQSFYWTKSNFKGDFALFALMVMFLIGGILFLICTTGSVLHFLLFGGAFQRQTMLWRREPLCHKAQPKPSSGLSWSQRANSFIYFFSFNPSMHLEEIRTSYQSDWPFGLVSTDTDFMLCNSWPMPPQRTSYWWN